MGVGDSSSANLHPRGPGGAARQASVLAGEGVTVETGALGELSVDLGTYGWFPNRLPSEGSDAAEVAAGDQD